MITTEQVKELRDKTGISIMQCRKALEEAKGDMAKAIEILKKKGAEIAAKKSDRSTGAGTIAAYIHSNGTVGSMVQLASETDFVSNNQEFKTLAYDIAMQVAAMAPENNPPLLEQPFIKQPELTIGNLIQNAIQKFGEKIEVVRTSRFSLSD